MKKYFFVLLGLMYPLSVLSLFSCGNRNPNLSENRMLAIVNDTTQIVEETPKFIFPDTSYVPPVGAKFTEIRSIDPDSPPVTLKVSIPQGVKEPLTLSRFGSSVEYVVLRLPDENDFFLSTTGTGIYLSESGIMGGSTSTQVNKLDDHYVTADALGIRLFDPSGRFVQNLLLSEGRQRTNQKIDIDFDGYKRATLSDISGTRCFLTFIDFEGSKLALINLTVGLYDRKGEGKIWVGEFDLAKRPLFTPQSELPVLTPGVEMAPARNALSGKLIDDNTWFSFRRVFDPIAISFNNMGDTLCKFTNYVNVSGVVYAADKSFFYRADGELFFRHEYCDTIFRVQSANRIVPAYCFDFGTQRLTPSEVIANKTLGKLIPYGLLVFKNSILLIFSEGSDCPNCRTRGEVTFYCLLYDKQTGRSTAIDLKSRYPENILIENDLDGGLPLPLNTLHREGNEIIATYTKVQIEEILNNNVGAIPAETVVKLKTMADTLKQNEMLVMRIIE